MEASPGEQAGPRDRSPLTPASSQSPADPKLSPSRVLKGHADAVLYVSLSDDGKIAASTSYDTCARTWDVTSGSEMAVFSGHSAHPTQCSLSGDGGICATTSIDGSVRVWDSKSGKELYCLQKRGLVASGCCLSKDGQTLFVTFSPCAPVANAPANDSEVLVLDWRARRIINTHTAVLSGFDACLGNCKLSADSSFLVACVTEYCKQPEGGVVLIDTKSGEPLHFWRVESKDVDAAIDKMHNVYVSSASRIVVYDGKSGNMLRKWSQILPSRGGAGIDVSANGKVLATSARVDFRMWDGAEQDALLATLGGHGDYGHGVAVSGNGRAIATACFDNAVRIFKFKD